MRKAHLCACVKSYLHIYRKHILLYGDGLYTSHKEKEKKWPIYSIEAIGIAIDLIKSC